MQKVNKKSVQYHAIFFPAVEGGYNVSFPALPGCVSFGRNFEEAKEKAQEILGLWLEELAEQGKQIRVYRAHPLVDEIEVTMPARAKVSYASNNP